MIYNNRIYSRIKLSKIVEDFIQQNVGGDHMIKLSRNKRNLTFMLIEHLKDRDFYF